MTVITIPIPTGPIAVRDERGDIVVTREWYKYFALLVKALGNSTTYVPDSIAANTVAPNLSGIQASITELRKLAMLGDVSARARLNDLSLKIKALEALVLAARVSSSAQESSSDAMSEGNWIPLTDGADPPSLIHDGAGHLVTVWYEP